MSLRIALTHLYAWPEVRRGGERYLHELSSALIDAGHEVTVLSTAPSARRDRVLGVEIRYLARHRRQFHHWFPGQGNEVRFAVDAFRRLAFRRFDVWHALGTADAAAAAFAGRFRSLRSVYTDLGVPELPYRDARSDWRFHRYVVRRVDRYVCLSGYAGDKLRAHYGREPDVLGGGVDLRAFNPGAARNPAPALLFTSDVNEPRKNIALLLEAVASLRARRPDLELWLGGPGDPSAVLAAAPPAARDAVRHFGVGSFDDLVDLYGRAWVTVLPSENEAFGLVVIESLACGTPVVTLAGGAPAEFVRPEVGATSARDPASLAEACERALDLAADPRTVAACRAAAQPHDWRRGIVPKIEAIYGGDAPAPAP